MTWLRDSALELWMRFWQNSMLKWGKETTPNTNQTRFRWCKHPLTVIIFTKRIIQIVSSVDGSSESLNWRDCKINSKAKNALVSRHARELTQQSSPLQSSGRRNFLDLKVSKEFKSKWCWHMGFRGRQGHYSAYVAGQFFPYVNLFLPRSICFLPRSICFLPRSICFRPRSICFNLGQFVST